MPQLDDVCALIVMCTDPSSASTSLPSVLSLSSLEVAATGALLDYISYTHKGAFPRLSAPHATPTDSAVSIDPDTRRSLELTHSLAWSPGALIGGASVGLRTRASLLSVVDRTVTAAVGMDVLLNVCNLKLYENLCVYACVGS